MSFTQILINPFTWIWVSIIFAILFIVLLIFLIILAKKTHAMVEFKAWLKGCPISIFFSETMQAEWKAIKPEGGVIYDKNYGSFIVNPKGAYLDSRTRNVLMPFDSQFGVGVNIHAGKLSDDLTYIQNDDETMAKLRQKIASGNINNSITIDALKTSINIGALKHMYNAILPHNITSKIEKILASRMKAMAGVQSMQIILTFVAILGAIVMGAILLKTIN